MITRVLSHLDDKKRYYIATGIILLAAYGSNVFLGTHFDIQVLYNILIGN